MSWLCIIYWETIFEQYEMLGYNHFPRDLYTEGIGIWKVILTLKLKWSSTNCKKYAYKLKNNTNKIMISNVVSK